MFFRFNIKTRLVIGGLLFVLGIFVLLQSFIVDHKNVPLVHGSVSDNLRGWGWSEGIGWISLNCYNDYDDNGTFDNCCPGGNATFCASYGGLAGGDYGVNFNTTSNKITGWAWSESAGWICFGETCIPPATCDGGTNDGNACTTDAQCPGGICAQPAPHGRTPWACVGRPSWSGETLTCQGDKGESFSNTANIVSQWKMNDAISDGATSDTISTNHGSLKPTPPSDAPTQVKGKYGIGLRFDGTNDYVEAADSANLSITGNLTLEAWVKRGSTGTEQTIVGKWDESGAYRSYRLWFGENNKLNFSVSSDGTAVATVTQNSKCIGGTNDSNVCTVETDCAGTCIRGGNPGAACSSNTQCTSGGLCDKGVCKNKPITDTKKWHHVAGKYVAGAQLKVFIDGRLAAKTSTGVPASIHDSTQPLYIGTKKGATVRDTYFNGVIDNVSIWNRAKTGNEIFDDAHMEVSGWAKAISSQEGGWFSLRGHTRGDKVWGAYVKDYLGFYTLGGFMGERHNNERMSTTNLVAHWKFNEHTWNGTANEVIDGSGSNNHGVAQGGVTTIDKGIFARAGEFDGTDDYVNLGDPVDASLDAFTAMTVLGWFKFDTVAAGSAGLLGKGDVDPAQAGTAYILWRNADEIRFYVNDDVNNASINRQATNAVTTGQWYHIIATWDGTAADSGIKIYIDGVQADDSTVPEAQGFVALRDSSLNLNIGRALVGTVNEYHDGLIDNVAIFSLALSATEIKTFYEKRKPYSAGWGDFDDDPPAPLAFNTLTTDSSVSCSQMLVQWEPSTWAESYSYWRKQGASSDCTACSSSDSTCSGYTEYSYLDTCSSSECSLSDTGLSENTGYCYSVEAHNETGDTFIDDSVPSNSAPQWKSTTLCPVNTGLSIDASVCGQLTLTWDAVTNADGYNAYQTLTSTGCDTSINTSGCEAIGHIGEALDYDANNDGTTDLVGHWKFNESSGTTVTDSSGKLNTGTATDADPVSADTSTPPSVETTALFSNARHFDGTDDYIDLPSVLDPSTTDFTIELWFNVDALGKTTDQNILTQEDDTTAGTGGQAWLFINDSGNAGATDDVIASYLGGAYTDTGVVPTAGSWYYGALTKSGTTIKIYINGELKVTGTQTTEVSDGGLRIGLSKSDTGAFDGVIDNASIYNVAKTAEQIRLDYEAGDCGGTDCGLDSTGVVCHQTGVDDSLCGKAQGDATACCFTDKRIVPFTNYYYKMTATNEAGESSGSTTLSGQTSCYPAPEAGEE
ncbi:hypothetical protein MYX06_03390 [Patescibacteria group bacterium AH-259-L05]|nr:hypothetical protein [Patescibacteria group bacterium AH-259-L05]